MAEGRRVVLETHSDQFPSSSLYCCIKNQDVDVLYNPTVGANLILDEFALAFLGDEVLVPVFCEQLWGDKKCVFTT